MGPRQSGKTTILEKLRDDLQNTGKQTVFLNLDIIEDRQWFSSQHALIELVERRIGPGRAVVFIDEISRLENAGLFLKGLYDLKSGHKFVVTGSGSLELKSNIIEPLTGRKQTFYCYPLSFTEFVAYKLGLETADFDEEYSKVTRELATQPLKRQRLVDEYVNFGGYPGVVLAQTEEEKNRILREVYLSYLEKDIGLLLHVEKEQAFGNLVKILASQTGNLINRAELSATLGVSEKTVERYLYLLEKTFVIDVVRPFYRNARKELVKSPKIYFVDLGFLYMAQGVLPTIQRRPVGNVFENACYLRIKELDFVRPAQFWRTKSGAEVDFVVVSPRTGNLIPVEVKMSSKGTFGKSLISFIRAYQPEVGYIYFQSGEEKGSGKTYGKTDIKFMPYHYLPEKVVMYE
ncbi:MAG: ATPase [Microgenomates group bacterium GW2011_GWB1_44_8]|nr:MAG: ATPase [Microgenomates group bacterium GW2011_GWB1_44_8]